MSGSLIYNPNVEADVCLLLEGTFPYVRGGVSTWVKQIIEGLPELTFSIIFLGANDGEYDEPAYEIPSNVVHIELHFLLGDDANHQPKKAPFWNPKRSKTAMFNENHDLHTALSTSDGVIGDDVARSFAKLLIGPGAITEKELQHSKHSWKTIKEKYEQAPEGLDFNHFFGL